MRTLSYIIFIIAFTSCTNLWSQVKYSNEYLSIGVGARAHGLSNAQVASVKDVSSSYWNPAGLAHITSPFQAAAMHAEWFAGIAQYDYLGIAKPLKNINSSVVSISLVRFGVDNIPNTLRLVSPDGSINFDNLTTFSATDYALFLSYGQKLKNPKISVGGSAKVIRRVIGRFANAWGFGIDLGAQYTGENWVFGIMGRDITSTVNTWSAKLNEEERFVFLQEGQAIPENSIEITRPRVILGAAYKKAFSEKVNFLAETNFDFTTDGQRNVLISSKYVNIDPKLGFEIGYNNFIYLRGGIGNFQSALDDIDGQSKIFTFQPNFGIGLKLGAFNLDYALTDLGDVSQVLYSHIFSVSIDFKSKELQVIDLR